MHLIKIAPVWNSMQICKSEDVDLPTWGKMFHFPRRSQPAFSTDPTGNLLNFKPSKLGTDCGWQTDCRLTFWTDFGLLFLVPTYDKGNGRTRSEELQVKESGLDWFGWYWRDPFLPEKGMHKTESFLPYGVFSQHAEVNIPAMQTFKKLPRQDQEQYRSFNWW